MESVAKHYKIILMNKGTDSKEVRYVPAFRSIDLLKQKIAATFQIAIQDIKLNWIDSEDDPILIYNQDDFEIALAQPTELKTFYVTSLAAQSSSNTEQPDVNLNPSGLNYVVCDVCDKQITAYRYKCLECDNYDLCGTCEGAGHHSEHIFLRLPSSEFPLSRYDRRVLHSAARDLKRSASKRSHRAEKEFKRCHGGKWEKKCQKDFAASSEASGCPFTGGEFNMEDIPRFGRHHLGSLLQTLNINPQERPLDGSLVSDVIRNAVESIFGRPEPTQQNNTPTATPTQENNTPNATPNAPPQPTGTTTATSTNTGDSNGNQNIPNVQENSKNEAEKVNPQVEKPAEMDWTFIQNQEPIVVPSTPNSTPVVASPTELLYPTVPQTNTTASTNAPPPGFMLHPDPIIAHGLAQLYEMGFSNDGDVLVRLLQKYKGNVAEVVKNLVNM